MSEKIIEILNKDKTACKLMKSFKEAAERQGLTDSEEYKKAHEAFLMMLIYNNKEALNVMAQDVYANANK